MSGDRIARALARIETAASRMEAAAPRAGAADTEISLKYANLRAEAGQALAEIDRLIETLQPAEPTR